MHVSRTAWHRRTDICARHTSDKCMPNAVQGCMAQEVAGVLTLCGCMGIPLKSVTILLAEVMCTGRMPVLKPPI